MGAAYGVPGTELELPNCEKLTTNVFDIFPDDGVNSSIVEEGDLVGTNAAEGVSVCLTSVCVGV